MARVKQTARKGPAKKKSPAKPRRSPRLAKELEDYDDTPAPEAEDTTHVQTPAQTRSDNAVERQDDRANVAAEAALNTPGYTRRFPAGGGYVIDNTNRRQILYADHLALCCTGPRCWLCKHCNTHLHAQADEFDDDGFVSLYEREHANINNNHVW